MKLSNNLRSMSLSIPGPGSLILTKTLLQVVLTTIAIVPFLVNYMELIKIFDNTWTILSLSAYTNSSGLSCLLVYCIFYKTNHQDNILIIQDDEIMYQLTKTGVQYDNINWVVETIRVQPYP